MSWRTYESIEKFSAKDYNYLVRTETYEQDITKRLKRMLLSREDKESDIEKIIYRMCMYDIYDLGEDSRNCLSQIAGDILGGLYESYNIEYDFNKRPNVFLVRHYLDFLLNVV